MPRGVRRRRELGLLCLVVLILLMAAEFGSVERQGLGVATHAFASAPVLAGHDEVQVARLAMPVDLLRFSGGRFVAVLGVALSVLLLGISWRGGDQTPRSRAASVNFSRPGRSPPPQLA